MKIVDIYRKQNLLSEGVKFGQAEISEVKKNSNKILIGIEYEFLPPEGSGGSDLSEEHDYDGEVETELRDFAEEVARKDFGNNGLEYLLDALWDFTTLSEAAEKRGGTIVPKLDDITSEGDLAKLRISLEFLKESIANSSFKLISVKLNDAEDGNNVDNLLSKLGNLRIQGASSTPFKHNVGYDSQDFMAYYKELIEKIEEFIADTDAGNPTSGFNSDLDNFIDTMGELIQWFTKLRWRLGGPNYNQLSEDIIKALAMTNTDLEELAVMKYGHSLDREIDSRRENATLDYVGGGTGIAEPEEIHNNMVRFGIDVSKIENYHTEHDDMVEFVTHPMPINDSIEFMKEMFKFIDSEATTPSFAGMHVNISLKGIPFKDLDILKLFILLDEQFYNEGDKFEKFLGFRPRDMVAKVLDSDKFDASTFIEIANAKNIDEIAVTLDDLIAKQKKYQALNFTHIFNKSLSEDRKRIEVRFFGGEDYHKREKEMEFQIYRLAYMLQAAFNPEFKRKEYLKKLVKFLDKVSRPEKRFYPVQKVSTTEAAIHGTALVNLYAALGDGDGTGGWTVRIYAQPFTSWLWTGFALMVRGGLVSLSDRRLRVGAPARRRAAVPAE